MKVIDDSGLGLEQEAITPPLPATDKDIKNRVAKDVCQRCGKKKKIIVNSRRYKQGSLVCEHCINLMRDRVESGHPLFPDNP